MGRSSFKLREPEANRETLPLSRTTQLHVPQEEKDQIVDYRQIATSEVPPFAQSVLKCQVPSSFVVAESPAHIRAGAD